jgi:hypothetical protein
VTALRTLADIEAAGAALRAAHRAAGTPPLTQAQADRVAALLAPYWPRMTAAQAAPHAA